MESAMKPYAVAFRTNYAPYGFSGAEENPSILAFTGQWIDFESACYPLGVGRRSFSPTLGRFISPDSLSPFGKGGLNAYGYCEGDPINYTDPTGKWKMSGSGFAKKLGFVKKTGVTKLLKEHKYMSEFKPFITAMRTSDVDVNALHVRPASGNLFAVMKLSKTSSGIEVSSPSHEYADAFRWTSAVRKVGEGSAIFMVDNGTLPQGVRGYQLFTADNYDHPFAFGRPLTDHPPAYEEPPPYSKISGIRRA
jgi:RHS repeat-associated protein